MKYLCLVMILFQMNNIKVFAEYPCDTTEFQNISEFTTYIADFNNDGLKDTVKSYIRKTLHSFPTSIHWAMSDSLRGSINHDKTIFIYPNWDYIDARVNVFDYNNDNVDDMMLCLWGRIELDSTSYLDTGMVVLFWGGENFIIDSTLDIQYDYSAKLYKSLVDNSSAKEPTSMVLDVNNGIINVKKNTHNSKANFQLDIPQKKRKNSVADKSQLKNYSFVSINPNPSDGIINYSINKLPQNIYFILVVDIKGQKLYQDFINITDEQPHYGSIDLSFLTNGAYYLIVHNNNKIISNSKFIINK